MEVMSGCLGVVNVFVEVNDLSPTAFSLALYWGNEGRKSSVHSDDRSVREISLREGYCVGPYLSRYLTAEHGRI